MDEIEEIRAITFAVSKTTEDQCYKAVKIFNKEEVEKGYHLRYEHSFFG